MDTRVFLNLTRDEKLKRREKYLHRARRDDPPPISPPRFSSKLSSHLHSSIHTCNHHGIEIQISTHQSWKLHIEINGRNSEEEEELYIEEAQ